MTVSKSQNPEKTLIEGEPVVNTETALMPYVMPRPGTPGLVLPPVLANSTYFNHFLRHCEHCVAKYISLAQANVNLDLDHYDRKFCSCFLKKIVALFQSMPANTGLNPLKDCPHRFS